MNSKRRIPNCFVLVVLADSQESLAVCSYLATRYHYGRHPRWFVQTRTASRGNEAFDLVDEAWSPDLIILDTRLPDMTAGELMARLESNRHYSQPYKFLFALDRSRLSGAAPANVNYHVLVRPYEMEDIDPEMEWAMVGRERAEIHPITFLPYGTAVNRELSTLLEQPGWGLLYIFLRGREEYTGRAGHMAYDRVQAWMADTMESLVDKSSGPDDFIGQLSPDEWIVIVPPARCPRIAAELEQQFAAKGTRWMVDGLSLAVWLLNSNLGPDTLPELKDFFVQVRNTGE